MPKLSYEELDDLLSEEYSYDKVSTKRKVRKEKKQRDLKSQRLRKIKEA